MHWHAPNEWMDFHFRCSTIQPLNLLYLNQLTTSTHWNDAQIPVLQKAVNVSAITRIIMCRKKILKTCVSGTKISTVDSFLQHISLFQSQR